MKFGIEHWGKDLVRTILWYVGPIKEWETRLFQFKLHSGIVDFIYNNCRMIMQTNDSSEWAYNLLVRCFDLLLWHQRWPESIQDKIPPDRQCDTRFCSWVQKMKFSVCKKMGIDCTVKFRSRGDMTRDPYIAAFTCAVWMRADALITVVSIPWYLYRPNTWAWHRYLKRPTKFNLFRYRAIESLSGTSDKEFVRVLKEMREFAVININKNS